MKYVLHREVHGRSSYLLIEDYQTRNYVSTRGAATKFASEDEARAAHKREVGEMYPNASFSLLPVADAPASGPIAAPAHGQVRWHVPTDGSIGNLGLDDES